MPVERMGPAKMQLERRESPGRYQSSRSINATGKLETATWLYRDILDVMCSMEPEPLGGIEHKTVVVFTRSFNKRIHTRCSKKVTLSLSLRAS